MEDRKMQFSNCLDPLPDFRGLSDAICWVNTSPETCTHSPRTPISGQVFVHSVNSLAANDYFNRQSDVEKTIDGSKTVRKGLRTLSLNNQSYPRSDVVEKKKGGSKKVKKCVKGVKMVDIYQCFHNKEMEVKWRPLPGYIEKVQKGMHVRLRDETVNWLIYVTDYYDLLPDTLHLAISYFDRYLSKNVVKEPIGLLLGFSLMLIAFKYEEGKTLNIDCSDSIIDNLFTKQEIVNMEVDLLKGLNFEMGNPTVKTFLRLFTRIAHKGYDTPNLKLLKILIDYLAELSLLDYECIKFLPSMVAASVIFLSRFLLEPKSHPWNSGLQQLSGYKPSDLKECVKVLHDLQSGRRDCRRTEIRIKYNKRKFKGVSELSFTPVIPSSFFDDEPILGCSPVQKE